MTTTSELFAIAEAAIEFDLARRVAAALSDRRNSLECAHVDAYVRSAFDGAGTYEAPEPCWKRLEWDYHGWPVDPSVWCAPCLERQRVHNAYQEATKNRGAKLRLLQRAALKQIDPRTIERTVQALLAAKAEESAA